MFWGLVSSSYLRGVIMYAGSFSHNAHTKIDSPNSSTFDFSFLVAEHYISLH